MVKEGSVAPLERVNIRFKSDTDSTADGDDPLRILMVGDLTGRSDPIPLARRKGIGIDSNNFDDVMEASNLSVTVTVPDRLTGSPDEDRTFTLGFKSLKDFAPEGIARQVPEAKKLLELRAALTALKSPITEIKPFRDLIQEILKDPVKRAQILRELGLAETGD